MKLGRRITSVAIASVLVTAMGAAVTVYVLSKRNRVDSLRAQMSAVLAQAENVADNMDRMYRNHAFATDSLLASARQAAAGRPLHEVYRGTAFYDAIPIVAAWQATARSAETLGFEFFTPSRPGIPARNPKNDNGAEFAAAFDAFAAGAPDYFAQDKKAGLLVYAVPVKLKSSCLTCHGDPANSPVGNGLDYLGFKMENLKEGDLKGAFVLRAPMHDDAVVARTMKSMALVTLTLLGAVVSGLYLFNRRFINRPLAQVIERIDGCSRQTSLASGQVSSTSHALADGANQQAAALEETSATIEEMASMTRRNAESAGTAKETATQTRASADGGAASMEALQTAMSEITTASADVTKILKTIDEIAFQTNILALNAAVEAARAGSAGAGFAVVADEVRSLAQRCATAARETATKIEECVRKSENGSRISNDVVTLFSEIQGQVQKLDHLVAEIATASREQSEGLQQITQAVTQMDQVTQRNAASAQEIASSAAELDKQAAEINHGVAALKKLVGQAGAALAHTPAAPNTRQPAA